MFDLVIAGGLVLDGTGRSGRLADVGVEGDRITTIGRLDHASAARRIDAVGLTVAPGFIDPHSHTDWTVHSNRRLESTIRQGVTTEVVGNCGVTNAPVSAASLAGVQDRLRVHGCGDTEVTWRSFGEYLADVEEGGISENLAFFVGHSTIRAATGVTTARLTEEQLQAMERHVAEAMDSGAVGLSSGLEYDEGRHAGAGELIRLASVAGRYGGCYASHIRNRDRWLRDAVTEFLDVVRASSVRGQLSHLNVRYDTGAPPHAWADAVAAMERARQDGLDVQADMTPFGEGIGLMAGILPDWLLHHGYGRAAAALADPEVRRTLRGDCDRYWRFLAAGDWHRARPLNVPDQPELSGKTFADIARARGVDPWDCYFDILASAGDGMASQNMLGELLTEDHLVEQLQHPLFGLGVDGYSASLEPGPGAPLTPMSSHGHVHYLAHHVRDHGRIRLEEAVRKMTNLPASRFGLHHRGTLAPSYHADIVVFDLDRLRSDSTWETPGAHPEGIPYVVVNGTLVVDQGKHTGARPGRVLRRA